MKFGALSRRGGRVAIAWRIEEAGAGEEARARLTLDWVERGGPAADGGRPRPSRPRLSRSGFGAELFERTLAYEIDAGVSGSRGHDGLTCRIRLPLPRPEERS